MNIHEAIRARHSVRKYTDLKIEGETAAALEAYVQQLNAESGLRMQLCLNEPEAFGSKLACFGMFKGVTDYLALVGSDGAALDETCGYYGEKFVLQAQMLGLNTCWVLATYNRRKCAAEVGSGEKLCCVIALGYGETQGKPRRSKKIEDVCPNRELPDWFRRGVEYALMAPTGVNQQDFTLELTPDGVRAGCGRGPCKKIDLGIVQCHFEIGASEGDWKWI